VSIVAIDGPTGVGKSTTSRAVAGALGATLILDPVSISPFLADYYTGEATPAAALAVELAFMRSRANLLIPPADGAIAVSDFSVMRTAPFAEFLDDPNDRTRVLDEMHEAIALGPQIDVLILLRADPEELLRRVRTRDRAVETELTLEHLEALTRHFDRWQPAMLAQTDRPILIDTMEWDPRRPTDLDELVEQIRVSLLVD
jgi:deoxyadenosine/deoxycytidine kinase